MTDEKILAEYLHDIYEEEAIKIGWITQSNCKVKFNDLPIKNREVMLAVAKRLLKNKFFKKVLGGKE